MEFGENTRDGVRSMMFLYEHAEERQGAQLVESNLGFL
jgi:hypothetical protein